MKKRKLAFTVCFLLPMLLEQSSFMPLFILSLLPRLPLFCQASPSFPSLSITLICNIPVLMGVGKMLCRRGNLLKTSPNGQVHLKSLINNFNYKILVLLQGLMCHCHRTVFFRKGHLFSKHFSWIFSSLTGRTLDTTEGKPGSLRQTAEEVNSFGQSTTVHVLALLLVDNSLFIRHQSVFSLCLHHLRGQNIKYFQKGKNFQRWEK